jgi:serine/threonine protein kinase
LGRVRDGTAGKALGVVFFTHALLAQSVNPLYCKAGLGYLAKIYEATNLVSGKGYSVKKVIRKELYPSDFAALSDELAVLQEVSKGGNTHTICLYEVYEDPDATYMVMEKIQGEILIDKLLQKKKYTEYDAKELVRNLLQGVNHCHRKKIAIRNLTLDNLILRNDSDSDIIITDFEIAKKVLHRNALKTQCGTQEFVAPEVLENRPAYDVSCDMWTVGVIVFILLGGYYPFRGKTEAEMLKNVRYGNYKFRDKFWNGVSADAISLLKSMMTVDPEERLTSEAALKDRWITMDRSVLSNDLTGNVAEIKKEVARKFRTVVKTVVATQRFEKQGRFL